MPYEGCEHNAWLVYCYDCCLYSGSLIHVAVSEAAAVKTEVVPVLEMAGIV